MTKTYEPLEISGETIEGWKARRAVLVETINTSRAELSRLNELINAAEVLGPLCAKAEQQAVVNS